MKPLLFAASLVVMVASTGQASAGYIGANSVINSRISLVALNPQPLPPKASSQVLNPGGRVSLNPQPLPPKESAKFIRRGDFVSLNPQPLPPKDSTKIFRRGDFVSLNPQPLPPKAVLFKDVQFKR